MLSSGWPGPHSQAPFQKSRAPKFVLGLLYYFSQTALPTLDTPPAPKIWIHPGKGQTGGSRPTDGQRGVRLALVSPSEVTAVAPCVPPAPGRIAPCVQSPAQPRSRPRPAQVNSRQPPAARPAGQPGDLFLAPRPAPRGGPAHRPRRLGAAPRERAPGQAARPHLAPARSRITPACWVIRGHSQKGRDKTWGGTPVAQKDPQAGPGVGCADKTSWSCIIHIADLSLCLNLKGMGNNSRWALICFQLAQIQPPIIREERRAGRWATKLKATGESHGGGHFLHPGPPRPTRTHPAIAFPSSQIKTG